MKMKYYAHNPMVKLSSDIWDTFESKLQDDHVVLLSEYGIKVVPFKDARADSYGRDLYLYQVNPDGKDKLLSSGSFN
jgi:hypothetical protein